MDSYCSYVSGILVRTTSNSQPYGININSVNYEKPEQNTQMPNMYHLHIYNFYTIY